MTDDECINCRHLGLVSLKNDTNSKTLTFCKAITLPDGSHLICNEAREDANGVCGRDAQLFQRK